MKKASLLLLLFIYAINAASAQGKLPAAFNNYNYFVEELNKNLNYTLHSIVRENCRVEHSWVRKDKEGKMSLYITIYTPINKPDEVENISMYISSTTDLIWWDTENLWFDVAVDDLANIIDNKEFTQLIKSIDYFDEKSAMMLLFEKLGYFLVSTNEDGSETKYYERSITIYNTKYYTKPASYTPPTVNEYKFPLPPNPDTLRHFPITKFESIFTNYKPLQEFISGLLKVEPIIDEDSDYKYYDYTINPDYNFQNNSHPLYQIVFSIKSFCHSDSAIYNIIYDTKSQKPEPDSWMRYKTLVDTLCSYFAIEKPQVFQNSIIENYESGSQKFYPANTYTASFWFNLLNRFSPCDNFNEKHFSATTYFYRSSPYNIYYLNN